MDQAKDMNQKKHVFIFSGQVYFHPQGQEGDVQSVHMNAVSLLDEYKINTQELAKVQMNMSAQLRARTGKMLIEVVDVVFNSISFMGEMTPTEWIGSSPEAQKEAMEEAMRILGQANGTLKSE